MKQKRVSEKRQQVAREVAKWRAYVLETMQKDWEQLRAELASAPQPAPDHMIARARELQGRILGTYSPTKDRPKDLPADQAETRQAILNELQPYLTPTQAPTVGAISRGIRRLGGSPKEPRKKRFF